MNLTDSFYLNEDYATVTQRARSELAKKAARILTNRDVTNFAMTESPERSIWVTVQRVDRNLTLVRVEQAQTPSWIDRARAWIDGFFQPRQEPTGGVDDK